MRPMKSNLEPAGKATPRSRRIGATARTALLCVMSLAAGLAMLAVLMLSIRGTGAVANTLSNRVAPAQAALRETLSSATTGQQLLAMLVQSSDSATRVAALTQANSANQLQNAAWAVYRRYASGQPGERALQKSYVTATARSVTLAGSLLGMRPGDPAFAKTFAAEQVAAGQGAASLELIDKSYYEPIVVRDTKRIVSGIDDTRRVAYLTYLGLALLLSAVGMWLIRSSRLEHRRRMIDEDAVNTEAQYANLETSLQRALGMELTEEATYDVIAQALTIVAPDVPSEMLLADSSQAHFRQVVSTLPGADAGCRVGSPGECPATLSGQTQFFKDSTRIDTCPYLRGRSNAVWATCVPVGIAGRTTGVLHMQGELGSPHDDTARGWDLIARKAGDRVGCSAPSRGRRPRRVPIRSPDCSTGAASKSAPAASLTKAFRSSLPTVISTSSSCSTTCTATTSETVHCDCSLECSATVSAPTTYLLATAARSSSRSYRTARSSTPWS